VRDELLTEEEMRAIEETYMKAEGISEDILMERAGKAVTEVILEKFSPSRTLVLCGPGKNGGDGKIVARHLQEKGWPVNIITLEHMPIVKDLQKAFDEAELIVDALVGTGLSRPLEGDILRLVERMNAAAKPIVSIDIPTGIDTNSGACCGDAVRATYTVTFFRARPGHYLLPGRVYTGRLFIKDIGMPDTYLPQTTYCVNTPALWKSALKDPQPMDHKYTRGACLIIGNGCMPGAIRLASLGARRIGAGLVRLLCKSEEYPIFAGLAWGDVITPLVSAQEFLDVIGDGRYKALLWGVGAFSKESTRDQALLLLKTKKPCVLDGGALSSFEGNTQELTNHLHSDAILTPHEGEFIRLFPHLAFLKNKAEKAQKAATETGAVIVLKGYDTIIASPEGKLIINANAPATLATAGTGDVLAGLMVGLLAQGLYAFQAAAAAVWIHGEAANRKGLGLIAEDLLDEIPAVLQGLSSFR